MAETVGRAFEIEGCSTLIINTLEDYSNLSTIRIMSKAGRQYVNSSTHTVSTKKSRARATAAINDYIMTLRSAIFTATGKDKDVTEGIAPMFMKYDRAGLDLAISFTSKMTKDEIKWAFAQCKGNMEEKYDRSGYGWDDDDKRKEFTEEGARFFIIREKSTKAGVTGRMVGFAHFRFSVQGDIIDQMVGTPTLFLWDIHLDETVRRKGLGKHVMMLLELIARREKMHSVSIPVQMFDESTVAWISNGMKGYSTELIVADVLAFDPDMEGFNVYSKAVKAKVVSAPSSPGPAAVSPVTVAASVGTPEKSNTPVAQASPQSIFDICDPVTDEIDGAVSSGESDSDSEAGEDSMEAELDFSRLDIYDTLHGLKVLYREKHGEEPSDEIVEQWQNNILNAVPSGEEEAVQTA